MARIPENVMHELEVAEAAGRCLAARDSSSRETLSVLAKAGLLVRPARSLYANPFAWAELPVQERARRVIRSYARMHPTWVFSGASAALLHGLEVSNEQSMRPCIAVTDKSSIRGREGVSRLFLASVEECRIEEIRATSFRQTVSDCLRILPFDQALAVADSALRLTGRSREELVELVAELARNKRGAAQARIVASIADGNSENGGESVARAHMYELGYMLPDLQVVFSDPLDPTRTYRVDYVWVLPDGSIVAGELDGLGKYCDPVLMGGRSTARVISDERRRESRILADAHVRMMRFSYEDACDLPTFNRILAYYGIPKRDVAA